ncbi:MAG: murein biosynthesis integral membrane protein MurJ, partial [Treponema sp.]|nr:murein biosynthesis integral membrane protein MurJ [Treponema sp.]
MSKTKSAAAGRSLLTKGLSLSFLTLCSRILGLVREMTKAKFLGTSALGDAFGIAFQVPNFCRRLFAENSVSVAFIPTFKKYLVVQEEADGQGETAGAEQAAAQGRTATQEFINATFTLVSFLTASLVTIGMLLAPLILQVFFPDQSAAAFSEAVVLTRIMFPYLVVISVAALFQGILNGHKLFSPSGFTPILFNAIVIALTYLLAPRMANPARAMAVGVIAGGSVQAAFQLPFVFRCGWHLSFTSLKKAFSNPGTRTVLRLVGPTVIGMAAYQLNDIVSSALATRAG